ncbi:hypothetical protein E2C01_038410 [Portunus trituberculatus]|uniref:VWFC domain-containing protein n=1 Tax=Portunus trituberculatus TaxID=210409 RepID=A0A5B7FC56_PORTR|nr:hypothetical protein [Portunus trituberculatus]
MWTDSHPVPAGHRENHNDASAPHFVATRKRYLKRTMQNQLPQATQPGPGASGKSSWECVAIDGVRVANGEMFVPGPDYCTVCRCEEGKYKECQSVLCQPPQKYDLRDEFILI